MQVRQCTGNLIENKLALVFAHQVRLMYAIEQRATGGELHLHEQVRFLVEHVESPEHARMFDASMDRSSAHERTSVPVRGRRDDLHFAMEILEKVRADFFLALIAVDDLDGPTHLRHGGDRLVDVGERARSEQVGFQEALIESRDMEQARQTNEPVGTVFLRHERTRNENSHALDLRGERTDMVCS